MSLAGRRYLVTGASGAIGAAIVGRLLMNGAGVSGLDRVPPAEDSPTRSARQFRFHLFDLADGELLEGMIDTIEDEDGPIDGLVHAAAIAQRTGLLDCSPEVWDRIVAINLTATFLLCQTVARRLAKRGGGIIIGLASGAALRPNANNVPYGASKAGLIGLLRAMAVDLAPAGIRTNILIPGLIDTPLMRSVAGAHAEGLATVTMLGRLGLASEVAEASVFLLGDEASFMTGSCLTVDGGASTAGLSFT